MYQIVFFLLTMMVTTIVANIYTDPEGGRVSTCPMDQYADKHARDCLKYDFGKALQCIGSLYDASKINNKTAELLTQQALDKLPSDNTYYSVGVQVGQENKLVMGVQKHHNFDWELSIPTRIYNMMSESTMITDFKKNRPILFYTTSNDVDVQEMPDWAASFSVPRIGGGIYPMYRHPDAKGGTVSSNCALYEKWADRKKLHDVGVMIIMPSNMWCPDAAKAYFDIVVGEIDLIQEKHEKRTYYLKWYKMEKGSSGAVPSWASKVFQ